MLKDYNSSKNSNYNFEILVGFLLSLFLIGSCFDKAETSKIIDKKITASMQVIPEYLFGFEKSAFHFEEIKIEPNQVISNILTKHGINFNTIADLETKAKDIFSVRKLKAGKNLTIIKEDECGDACCVIYEPDRFRYVKYDFRDSVNVEIVEKDVTIKKNYVAGQVDTSIWVSLKNVPFMEQLVDKMVDALDWSVNFIAVQEGDQYKLVYDEKYIDGELVGIGNVYGAYFKNNKEHYAVYYENEDYQGFYDLEGRASKKAFLRTPVKFSRISSRFNRNRFHPILKRRRPHLGTDYAAAYGTPIRSVADGVVELVSYTKSNGKYVKIRHDKTYQSQYLHMSKFAKGMKRGVRVKQNQTIGYVGSTGLATGPHVCFRFWKNGKQINHLNENFPPSDPMKDDELPAFFSQRDKIKAELDNIHIEVKEDITSNKNPDKVNLRLASKY